MRKHNILMIRDRSLADSIALVNTAHIILQRQNREPDQLRLQFIIVICTSICFDKIFFFLISFFLICAVSKLLYFWNYCFLIFYLIVER